MNYFPNYSPVEFQQSLQIGTVDSVSAAEICVLLDTEAPESVALNTGTPHPFPRVNGYVFIHTEKGFLVSQVASIFIKPALYPKRKGLQDFGLIDLPFPLRKMLIHPLGELTVTRNQDAVIHYQFHRGIDVFPSLGDAVLIPTPDQLQAIIESGDNRRVMIGTSPLGGNAKVMIDPDKLFGRHCAVLGNTGSGKSCSVAGLIRWSLEAASKEPEKTPNARFIILDPNGEYRRAFHGRYVTVFSAQPTVGERQLEVPLWFWNAEEWCAIAQASDKMQKPLLKRALTGVRDSKSTPKDEKTEIRRYLSLQCFKINNDLHENKPNTSPKPFGLYLKALYEDLCKFGDQFYLSKTICTKINDLERLHFKSNSNPQFETYGAFGSKEVETILTELHECLQNIGGMLDLSELSSDVPKPFKGTVFANFLEMLAMQENCSQHIDPLVLRIQTLLSDRRMKAIIDPEKSDLTLQSWLEDFLGNDGNQTRITIIDLSLVPAEIVFTVTSVIARMVLEALQRYRKNDQAHRSFPTVLVMEEAHTFIQRRSSSNTDTPDAASRCCQIFEKIAREGRKFGLGLLLSSQRPSELSPSVLSQCNTFLLHRISNDKDQEMVAKLLPDNLQGLLGDLPILPSRQAILMGWAAELPILVQMNELPDEQRPQSDDPDFWDVWTQKKERSVDWGNITGNWQNPEK